MIEIIPNWHPVFVHFTVALLSVAVALYLLVRILPGASVRQELAIVARWSLWIGTVLALATAVAGWLAYNSVAHDDISHAAMTEHRNWALVTATIFVILALWSWGQWQQHPSGGVTGAVFLLALTVGHVATEDNGRRSQLRACAGKRGYTSARQTCATAGARSQYTLALIMRWAGSGSGSDSDSYRLWVYSKIKEDICSYSYSV